jgi:hypothetical protein
VQTSFFVFVGANVDLIFICTNQTPVFFIFSVFQWELGLFSRGIVFCRNLNAHKTSRGTGPKTACRFGGSGLPREIDGGNLTEGNLPGWFGGSDLPKQIWGSNPAEGSLAGVVWRQRFYE